MAGSAALTIVYFAWVRDLIGSDSEVIDHPGADTTITELVTQLIGRSAGHAAAFSDVSRVRAALDQQFVAFDATLGSATELALFPPVTGG